MPDIERETALNNKINTILSELESGERTITPLPKNGFLFLEHEVPYILIYRQKPDDKATHRLVRTGASYLVIGEGDFDFYKDLLYRLTKKMADNFGSYILLEVFSGPENSSEFIIKGPAHKLPVSLETLKSSLEKIKSRKYGVEISARIEKTQLRQESDNDALFTVNDLKHLGATFIGLQVPPIYRDKYGEVLPVYFRKFRDSFANAIQKSIFEFVRVQTSSKLINYNALGKRKIHKEVFEIDRQLADIQNSYQFLLLVAPVNIHELRQVFFDSKFETIKPYHYRLLPIDPDILKRRLYNLPIDKIDDPALSYLFDEKRQEIDQELTMLKERGTKNFFYSSVRLYKGMGRNVISEAEMILKEFNNDEIIEDQDKMDIYEFEKIVQKEFEYFRGQSEQFKSRIHIRPDVNIMMVSDGELYLPADYRLTKKEALAFTQHEIGTHVLTHFNGSQQPLKQMAIGLADYDALQEGIAVLSEYLIGGLSRNRLRILAGRVMAGQALLEGANFIDVFKLLRNNYNFHENYAFNITSRMFQGGGFLKDIIYLKGLVELRDYLIDGGELLPLLAGKFSIKHKEIIEDLTKRDLLKNAQIKPRYMQLKDYDKKIKLIREGLGLTKMI